MPKKCRDLAGEVTVDGKDYVTSNDPNSDLTYSYYRKAEDPEAPFTMHFTVVNTGKGKADFEKFHITFSIPSADGKSEANAKFNYQEGQPDKKVSEDAVNLHGEKKKIWDEEIKPHKATYDQLALEFWKNLNK